MKRILSFLFLCICWSFIEAQDVHFSQFGQVPFYLNPAKSGLMSENYRFSANSKIQWNAVTTPFQTYLAAVDMGIQRKGSHLGKWGLGLDVMREKAGDAGFGTSGFGLSLSYIKALNRFNNRFLSGGVSARIHQRSFDGSALYFDNQFNGLYFDPALPVDESFSQFNFWFPVFGSGLAYFDRIDSRHDFMAGLSAMNINRPPQSHLNDNGVRLKTRWTANMSYRTAVGRDRDIIPSAFFSMQGVYREVIVGAEYRLTKSYNPWDYRAFSGGLFYRAGDGAILSFRLDYLNYRFGISYDVNLSDLVPASDLRGGFEFSLIALFNKPEHKTSREIPCPIF